MTWCRAKEVGVARPQLPRATASTLYVRKQERDGAGWERGTVGHWRGPTIAARPCPTWCGQSSFVDWLCAQVCLMVQTDGRGRDDRQKEVGLVDESDPRLLTGEKVVFTTKKSWFAPVADSRSQLWRSSARWSWPGSSRTS